MDCKVINGTLFNQILQAGFQNLSAHFQDINDLNVFPVPDGDTGTNMKLTMANGLKQIKESESISSIAQDLAKGMLFGARGNSGVLSSRYFNGLAKGLEGKEEATVFDFVMAMVEAYKVAYRAVADPAEGTILTVAREGIETIRNTIDYENITYTSFFSMVVQAMKVSLDNTPNLLPILKESGVVDSGGKGLLTIFEGFLKFFTGEEIGGEEFHESASALPSVDYSLFNENSVLDYGYCTEFLLQLMTSKIDVASFNLQEFIQYLSDHGNSIVCFQNGTIVKVHIHTKKPYEIIEFAQRYGEFVSFKMENMSLQHNEVLAKKEEKKKTRKKYAVVSIAQGDGIIQMFKDLGSDIVINGGQTMNTSSAELIDAFKEANADEIIVLPDESNILMAARQAADLYKDSHVRVLETKTIPAGYACLGMIVGDEETADECYDSMEEINDWLVSGFICKSSRDTSVNGVKCIKGDYIEGVNNSLVGCNKTLEEAVDNLLANVEDIENKEALFFFYGQTVSAEQADALVNQIQAKYPRLEVAAYDGKQDVYDLLIGIN